MCLVKGRGCMDNGPLSVLDHREGGGREGVMESEKSLKELLHRDPVT